MAFDECKLAVVLGLWLEKRGWLVLPEFGVASGEGMMQIDLAGFKWKDDGDVQAMAVECKCLGTARESLSDSLEQAIEYQVLFTSTWIATERGRNQPHQISALKKLGIGYMMVNSKGKVRMIAEERNAQVTKKTPLRDD